MTEKERLQRTMSQLDRALALSVMEEVLRMVRDDDIPILVENDPASRQVTIAFSNPASNKQIAVRITITDKR